MLSMDEPGHWPGMPHSASLLISFDGPTRGSILSGTWGGRGSLPPYHRRRRAASVRRLT